MIKGPSGLLNVNNVGLLHILSLSERLIWMRWQIKKKPLPGMAELSWKRLHAGRFSLRLQA